MAARFWFATFSSEVLNPVATGFASGIAPLDVAGTRSWAIEVITGKEECAVLFSTGNDPLNPANFTCQIGFANGAETCTLWHARGLPLVDARIERQSSQLTAHAICFRSGDNKAVVSPLVSLPESIDLGRDWIDDTTFGPLYTQFLQVPDSVEPSRKTKHEKVVWRAVRSNVRKARNVYPLRIAVSNVRWPVLAPFRETMELTPTAIWTGDFAAPDWPPEFPDETAGSWRSVESASVPPFHFEKIELLGFRIDLREFAKIKNDSFDEILSRLNFHLDRPVGGYSAPRAASDFLYREATQTLNLELLRYGKMMIPAEAPLTAGDFQYQHELVTRILVGRVDDDTSQGRDPAVYVPVVFVDNAWSKMLGRDYLGLEKCMAEFCVTDRNGSSMPLGPDGRLAAGAGKPEELASVREIRLNTLAGVSLAGWQKPPLLKIDCPFETFLNWDTFQKVGLDLAFSASPFAPGRWRQSDFDNAEFRRSFARSAIGDGLHGFGAIQVCPLGDDNLKAHLAPETTWIKGAYEFGDDLLVAWPSGTIGLTFCAAPSAPKGWLDLCELFGIESGESKTIRLPTRSWYRMLCSMDFRLDDGLG